MYQTKPTRTSICEHRNSGLVHGLTFSCVKTNNICIARLMMRKQKLNMNFQYTALNMNYSVAGFQVDCLVTNFPKGLLVAIYAGKKVSAGLQKMRGGHFTLKYHLFFLMLLLPWYLLSKQSSNRLSESPLCHQIFHTNLFLQCWLIHQHISSLPENNMWV